MFDELDDDDFDYDFDQGQGHRRSQVKVKFSQKWIKNETTAHISDAISSTDFILGTKIHLGVALLLGLIFRPL